MKRLIVNADDLGLTPGVNRIVFRLGEAGAVTSATLMASSLAFEDAIGLIRQRSAPAVGCHLIFVDGTPILPSPEIPSLAPGGLFRSTLGSFVSDLLRNRIVEAEIEAEATAQIRKVQQAGVKVTHIDTHKHTHMFPGVLRPVLRAALACGVKAIRNPYEPQWSIRATPRSTITRRAQVAVLNTQKGTFYRLVREAGLSTTDGAIGVVATGTLDRPALHSLLQAIPDGTWELVCHPGLDDQALRNIQTRLRNSREIEADALAALIPATASQGINLIHFGSL
ncbi:MAG: ChbG/HpnK family deacetylase [Acidobacteria bacterium]|nr:ChbG/HpnK family deacetylase [Acidobacteriota bacterium]